MERLNDEIIPIKKMSDPPEQISAEEMEWRIKEIIKCKKDIVYFAENYFRIISLDGGLKLIKLYEKQKELLRAFADNRRTIALASRQTGKCVSADTKVRIRLKCLKLTFSIPIGLLFKIQKALSLFGL